MKKEKLGSGRDEWVHLSNAASQLISQPDISFRESRSRRILNFKLAETYPRVYARGLLPANGSVVSEKCCDRRPGDLYFYRADVGPLGTSATRWMAKRRSSRISHENG